MTRLILSLACLFCLVQIAFAQEPQKREKKKKISNELSLENDTTPNMEYRLISDSVRRAEILEQSKRRSDKKKNKEKKIYYGIKTKVIAVRREGADKIIDVAQFVPVTHLINNPYQQAIFYYDKKARKIKNDTYYNLSGKLKKGLQIYLLHGKYQRIRKGNVEFIGYYYKGLTHDTWKQYDKNNILVEKLNYHMGYAAESRIAYYDEAETKFKEIVPVEHKILHGMYYKFHENGTIAEAGEYTNGEKVGIWTEYFDNRQKKKQTQYTPEYKWHSPEQAYMMMEWDKYGKVTFDYKKDTKDKK
jgi:antitoxin component YwqK of YwqJK toxin-antitoxin module